MKYFSLLGLLIHIKLPPDELPSQMHWCEQILLRAILLRALKPKKLCISY